MKLRLRSLESGETLKLEVPNACTILELKELLSSRISNGASSFSIPPGQLFLTLNRKDELSGSSLQSVGVTSGDLIFYSLNPTPDDSSSHNIISNDLEKLVTVSVESNNMADDQPPHGCSTGNSVDCPQVAEKETLEPSASRVLEGHEITGLEVEGVEDMEVDEGDDAYLRSLSVPSFLKKVFENEIGSSNTSNGCDSMLLKVAVHAVLLESGFVGYDPVSSTKLDGFHLPDGFPSLPLHYTITEVLSFQPAPCVAIKFQTLGKFINVNGSLANKFIYRVCLDVSRFAPALHSVWKHGNIEFPSDGNSGENPMLNNSESDVFEFWKLVKDDIALPLLIDLCESVDITPPSSLMMLPTDLKLKILELLPGTDIAKVACTCAELRFISSTNVLWRQKYEEKFGNASNMEDTECSWKLKFSRALYNLKRRRAEAETFRCTRMHVWGTRFPFRDPVPFGVPRIIGGDYDLRPGMIPNPYARRRRPTYPNFF